VSWARYDDELPYNRKVAWLRAHGVNGIAALGLHLLANTWSRHEGQQGFIPDYIPEQLVGKSHAKLVTLLAGIDMFTACENGWMINDYDQYGDRDDGIPVTVKVERLRKVRAEAGRKGGNAKAANRASKPPSKREAELVVNGWQTSTPVPVPDPVSSSVELLGGGSVTREQEPPLFCKNHPNGHDGPCGACADARRAHTVWLAVSVQRAEQAKRDLAAVVKSCPNHCINGWIEDQDSNPVRKCNHQAA
jgi:hypothetical protein